MSPTATSDAELEIFEANVDRGQKALTSAPLEN